MTTIRLLERYHVDRAQAVTLDGPAQLVVLMLTSHDGTGGDKREVAIAMARVDAALLAQHLQNAALDAQKIAISNG